MQKLKILGFLCALNIISTVFGLVYNFPEFAEVSYYVVLFLLCLFFFFENPKNYEIRLLIAFLFLFLIPIAFHYFIYKDYSIIYIFHYLGSILGGIALSRHFTKIPFKLIYYIVFIIEYLAIILAFQGDSPEFLNRTYFTVPMVIIFFCVVLSDHFNEKNFSYFSLALLFVIAILSNSRSVTAIILMLVPVFIMMKLFTGKYKANNIFITPIIIVTVALCVYLFIDTIASNSLFQRFNDRGLDSGRFLFWGYYVFGLGYQEIFFGVNINQLWISLDKLFFKDGGRHTLHNSFLSLHSHAGLISLIFVTFIFSRLIVIRFWNDNGKFVLGAFIVLIAKANFDVIFFPQRFDLLIFAIIFYLYSTNTNKNLLARNSKLGKY
jgi:hypothetical protein